LPVGASAVILTLEDIASVQVDLRLNPDGTLSITRNGTALAGGTSSSALSIGAWCHLELKVKIDPSVGTAELRRNGVAIVGPLTSLNTRATGTTSVNGVRFGYCTSTGATISNLLLDFDDIIIWDAQTTDPAGNPDISDFIGDCGLSWLLPTGAGTTTQFTPDSGSNYARVNETTPDGDTSYVQSVTVGQFDTYAMADLPGTIATVKSIAVVPYARKTDVGPRQLGAEIRTGGANFAHPTSINLGTTYLYHWLPWGSDPTDGSVWTPTKINAIEAGPRVNS
jgi:hypothetical protein